MLNVNTGSCSCPGVSIRTRPCGRAMRYPAHGGGASGRFQSAPDLAAGRCLVSLNQSSSPLSFNPHPTLRPGDASGLDALWARALVSIRTRPCGRAMRDAGQGLERVDQVSIRTRPCGRAMRGHGAQGARDGRCFNPHPTLRPGDAMVMTEYRLAGIVSIRTRPCGRAMRYPGCRRQAVGTFQSAPDLAAGRCE